MKGFLFMFGKNARILFWDQPQCEMLNTTIFQYQNLCFFLSDKKKNKRNLKMSSNISTVRKGQKVNYTHSLGLKEGKRWAVQRENCSEFLKLSPAGSKVRQQNVAAGSSGCNV